MNIVRGGQGRTDIEVRVSAWVVLASAFGVALLIVALLAGRC